MTRFLIEKLQTPLLPTVTLRAALLTIIMASIAANAQDGSLKSQRKKIATAYVGADEIVLELLTRAGRASEIIAMSKFADDPRYSNLTTLPPTVRTRIGGEIESTLKGRPDLVILAPFNRPEIIHRFRDAKVATVVAPTINSLADIETSILTIGQAIDTKKEARALAKSVRSNIERHRRISRERKQNPVVLGFAGPHAIVGTGTLFDDIVRTMGAKNAAAPLKLSGWPKISLETLVTIKADYVVISGEPSQIQQLKTKLQKLPGWKALTAVKRGKIIPIPERELSATSHHIIKALARLQKALAR